MWSKWKLKGLLKSTRENSFKESEPQETSEKSEKIQIFDFFYAPPPKKKGPWKLPWFGLEFSRFFCLRLLGGGGGVIKSFTRNSRDLRSLSRSRNPFILRKNTAPRFEQKAVQQQLFSCSYYSWVEQETDKQLFCCSFLLLFLKQVVDLHFSAVFLLLLFLCWNRKLTCSCSPSSAPKNQPN